MGTSWNVHRNFIKCLGGANRELVTYTGSQKGISRKTGEEFPSNKATLKASG